MTKNSAEVAIIGMACRLPGAAHDLDGLLDVVLNARDATSELPADRYAARSADLPGSVRHGGFLSESLWHFDHAAFSISLKEASYTDPQHRLLLETCYHALEDAGIDPASLKGKRCGVFVGLSTQDYARRMTASGDYNGLFGRGSGGCMAAGRISYHLGLEGPSVVVDTACSSSLVAVHQARAALAAGECDLAIVAGVTLLLSHDYGVDFNQAGMLAADGRCKPFTTRADGFARGEGVGAVVLMNQAEATGRRVYASILGSAINSDGRSNGITAPSQKAQRRVITAAMADAGVRAEQVAYVETHGTGTDLGDRIELSALADVFGERTTPLYLGALKANIAHTESAAGIAGLIKAALCVDRGFLPPHAFHADVDGGLALERFQGTIPGEPVAWTSEDGRRIGGVSSFGISGTNAHVILADPELDAVPAGESGFGDVLHLSARTPSALQAMALRYAEHLEARPELDVKALGTAVLQQRQLWSNYRLSVVGSDASELAAALRSRADAAPVPAVARKILLQFNGQGEVPDHPGFQAVFDQCAAEVGAVERTDELSRFLVDYALGRLWLSLGVRPYAVIGRGVGQYAAAVIAGVLDLETAVRRLRDVQVVVKPAAFSVWTSTFDAPGSASMSPIPYEEAVGAALAGGVELVLDLGSRSALTPHGEAVARAQYADRDVRWLSSESPEALAELVEYGGLDPRVLHATDSTSSHVDLPRYPFDRNVLRPSSWSNAPRRTGQSQLVSGVAGAGTQEFAVDANSWVAQHRVGGQAVLPGTFYLTAALELAARWLALGGAAPQALEVRNVTLRRPVVFASDTAVRQLQFEFDAAAESGRHPVRFLDEDRALCVEAQVGVVQGVETATFVSPAADAEWESSEAFYTQYAEHGVEYGELFRRVARFHRVSASEIVARIEPPAGAELQVTHPALLDSCLHSLGMAVGLPERAYAPVSINALRFFEERAWDQPLLSHVTVRSVSPQVSEGDVRLYSEQGQLVAELLGITCRGIADTGFGHRRLQHELVWDPRPLEPAEVSGENWVLLGSGLDGLRAEIERHGARVLPLAEGLPPVNTLVVGGVEGLDDAEALASYLKNLHEVVSSLELQQLCVWSGEDATAKAIALAFPTEFPRLRAGALTSDTNDAVAAIVTMRTDHAQDGLVTPYWRYAAGELSQQQTRLVESKTSTAFKCHEDGV